MRWVWGLVVLAIACLLSPEVGGQPVITLKYCYPVGVSGPINRLMTEMVNEFNGSHPGIRVEPVFAGNYVEAMAKAMTAFLGGTPPDLAVLDTPELFSLLDRDAIVPLDDLIAQSGGKRWLDDFYGALLLNARTRGHIYSIPGSVAPPSSSTTRTCSGVRAWTPTSPPGRGRSSLRTPRSSRCATARAT